MNFLAEKCVQIVYLANQALYGFGRVLLVPKVYNKNVKWTIFKMFPLKNHVGQKCSINSLNKDFLRALGLWLQNQCTDTPASLRDGSVWNIFQRGHENRKETEKVFAKTQPIKPKCLGKKLDQPIFVVSLIRRHWYTIQSAWAQKFGKKYHWPPGKSFFLIFIRQFFGNKLCSTAKRFMEWSFRFLGDYLFLMKVNGTIGNC